MLDHLFRLINTPAPVTERVIPPFVTSNPLFSYIQSVVGAFRIKTHDGKTYSGTYGDLGAMASLLNPERSSDVNAKYSGTLREPMVKVIHSMRAVEYRDAHDEPIVFSQFQNVFGQFPLLAPSVFNFYVSEV